MTTLHETVSFNVEASINQHFIDRLAEIDRPVWLQPTHWATGKMVVLNWPEIELNVPCFSLFHLPGFSSDRYQGRNETDSTKVVKDHGMMQIDCWVNRDQKYNGQDIWKPRLSFMEGMVRQASLISPTIVIKNYLGIPGSPLPTSYRVVLGDLSVQALAQGGDVNPSIERTRFLLNYEWHQRADV